MRLGERGKGKGEVGGEGKGERGKRKGERGKRKGGKGISTNSMTRYPFSTRPWASPPSARQGVVMPWTRRILWPSEGPHS